MSYKGMLTKEAAIFVGAPVLAAQLATRRDPAHIDDGLLARLADLSIRAAQALVDAADRFEAASETLPDAREPAGSEADGAAGEANAGEGAPGA